MRQNMAVRSVPRVLEAKPEVEIWWRPNFLTRRPRLPIWPNVGQSTQLLPVLQIHFRFDHDDFLHAFFRITVNFSTFRTISCTFESTSGFSIVLPGQDLDFLHPVFAYKAFLAVSVRYGDNTGQNKAKKSVPGALEAKPELEISRRPGFLVQRPRLSICPKVGQKYTTTSGLGTTTFCTHFSNYDQFHDISDRFGQFWKYFRFLNCTSRLQI